ncbi:MAG: hypothetical protein KDK36_17130 [Leptospiraceae bacterium]|nr:hypothetical protein [Leptospiraceae bacterium]
MSFCKKKRINQEIRDCDTMGNYYEDGEHYISREFVDDESGSLNYEKLFEKMDRKNSKCDPEKTFNPEEPSKDARIKSQKKYDR